MKPTLALAAVLLSVPAFAMNFDAGVDVSVALEKSRAAAASMPSYEAPPASYRPDNNAHDFQCRDIVFSAAEKSATLSAGLESHDLTEDGKIGSIIHYGGAAITIRGRQFMFPWESESFRVCMEGTMIDMTPSRDNPHDYLVVEKGSPKNDWTWTLAFAERRHRKPDPEGVTALFMTGAAQKVVFTDKWAAYYENGSLPAVCGLLKQCVEIKFEVKRAVSKWKDAVLMKGTLRSATKEVYELDLGALDLRRGQTHYIEYSIRRTGDASYGGFGKTQRADAVLIVF